MEAWDADDGAGISTAGWLAAGIGFVLAAVVLQMPFLSFIFSYLGVLVHEMGHALVGWLYGYPSIPAFDFVYGGGVTSHSNRMPLLAVAVLVGLGALTWLFRRNPASLWLCASATLLCAVTAWSSAHRAVITGMGHGFELVIAGVFLHRALSGRACHHDAERIAYGFVGWFLTLDNVRFAYRLITDPAHRRMYEQAKGGGHWMDFSVLAEQYLHAPLAVVAFVFLLLCFLPPALSALGNHHRTAVAETISRLRRVA
jgi:hypothetical protein